MMRRNFEAIAEIASLLGIPVAAAFRPSVVENLERLFEQAGLVMESPLAQEVGHPLEFEP